MPRRPTASKYPHYPKIFNILATLQIIASGIVVVFFWVAWANIMSTPVLREDLALVEKTSLGAVPNEWRSPWYWKLLHAVAHLSLVSTIILFTLNRFGRVYPPFALAINFAILFLYIAGVAGVAAFSFALDLVGKCNEGIGCTAYKVGFFTAHGAGLLAWALMLLDAFAWGRLTVHSLGYREFGKEEEALRPMHLRSASESSVLKGGVFEDNRF